MVDYRLNPKCLTSWVYRKRELVVRPREDQLRGSDKLENVGAAGPVIT